MGITGEIVRSVFAKGRPVQIRHHCRGHQGRIMEKKRWRSSVRSYLCGDQECDSVIAEDDNASVRSSTVAEVGLGSFRSNRAATISINTWGGDDTTSVPIDEETASLRSSETSVNQPLDSHPMNENPKEKKNSTYNLFQQKDAALIIQSAFRTFRAKRVQDGAKMLIEKHERGASPSRESVGTSIEVQTGNSSDIFSIKEERDLHHAMRHRAKAQVLKIQEDWDDSTVSSVISKMRIQNRAEAATRRERALAYAFSQQLRICSKRKQSMAKGDETSTGWSWLERWMAARQQEINLMDDNIRGSHRAVIQKKMMDGSIEEKESCGSNDVTSSFEVGISSVPKSISRPAKIRTKAIRSFSRQTSTYSSHLCPKDVKKVHDLEDEKEMRKRRRQPSGNKKEIKNSTAQI